MVEHLQELLEEIRGLTEGAQLPYDSILLKIEFPFTVYASSDDSIFSVFGTATTDRLPIVGRNYDLLLGLKHSFNPLPFKERAPRFSESR